MKKFIILVIGFLLLTFINVQMVSASANLCDYRYQVKRDTWPMDDYIQDVFVQINIDGSTTTDGWPVFNVVYSDSCPQHNPCEKTASGRGGTITALNSNFVYIDEESFENLKKGICPSSAFIDLYNLVWGLGGDNEVCLGTQAYCEGISDGGNFWTLNDTNAADKISLYTKPTVIDSNARRVVKYQANSLVKYKEIFKVDEATCKNFESIDVDAAFDQALEYAKNSVDIPDQPSKDLAWAIATSRPEFLGKIKDDTTQYIQYFRDECTKLFQNDTTLTDEEKEEAVNDLQDFVSLTINDLAEKYKGAFGFEIYDNYNFDETCIGFLGDPKIAGDPAYYLKYCLNIMKYLGIICALLLSIMDFAKAVTSQDKDLLRKAIMTSVKRLIFAVVIFFLPIVLDFILGLVGAYSTCV